MVVLDELNESEQRKKQKEMKLKHQQYQQLHQHQQRPISSSSPPSARGSCATACGEGSAAPSPTRRWARRRKRAGGLQAGWDGTRKRRHRSSPWVRLQRRACRVLLLGLLRDGRQERIELVEAIVLAARRALKGFTIAPEIQCASTGG